MESGAGAAPVAAQDFVAFHAAAGPNRLAALDVGTGVCWTYRQLHDRVARCVTVFAMHGVSHGDRVAVLARNSVELVVLHLACSRIGAIFVALNWRLAPSELSVIIADAAPGLLVVDAMCAVLAERSATAYRTVGLAELRAAIVAAAPSTGGPVDPDAPAIMLYTSGTSGRPKGVVLSERNAYFTGVNFCLSSQIVRDSVLLCEAPMFHVIGLVIGLRACLYQGAAILISDGFDPAITNERFGDDALGVTHYFCVPQMAAALRSAANFDPRRLGRLKALLVGGAPSDPADVIAWLDDGIAFANGYGMTEIGSGAGMPLDVGIIRQRPGAVGLVPPTQRMRTVDGEGRDVPPGTAGEIWFKGPNVFQGYWNRPEETDQVFTTDGWFRTGDVGVSDSDGYLTIVDRKKDMFISGGENVYPAEVELTLLSHSDVQEVAVVGVDDTRWGEVGCAFLVARQNASLRLDDLRAHCLGQMAGYKIPKYFVRIESLPRTGSGKVLKHVIKTDFLQGRHRPLA